MLTKLNVRLFKRFRSAEIELGNPVVFIGPNDSGKTTALQALALWGHGLQKWVEKRESRPKGQQRTGVAINRRDLVVLGNADWSSTTPTRSPSTCGLCVWRGRGERRGCRCPPRP